MKTQLVIFLILIGCPVIILAQIADPLSHFKATRTIPNGDKILKWECDVDGGGKTEVLLSLKSRFDEDVANHQPPAWVLYLANASGSDYALPQGIQTDPETIEYSLPDVDPDACFVGPISELNKRGIVTMSHATQRSGLTMVTIYAYTIVADHLKRDILAKYNFDKGPNALFLKYLADNKRTIMTFQEVTP